MKASKRTNRQRGSQGRRTRRAYAPRPECLEERQLLTATWFVDAASPASGADGSSLHPFPTIQAAINAAGAGDVVDIAAGTYAESLRVDKSLTLDGPNAGVNPNFSARAAEAVLVPPGPHTGSVVQVLADNVTINGLTIDGDNPTLDPADGTTLNGVPSFALRGVANFSSAAGTPVQVSGMIVEDDIIRNFTLFGVLGDTPEFAVSSGNVITQNAIDNIPSASTDTALMGRGVSLEDDFYGDVTDNVVTRTFQGIQALTSINPGPVSSINANTVYAYDTGINLDLQDAGTNTYNITNNQVFAEAGADATSTGIRIGQVLNDDTVSLSNNNVSGFQTGIELRYIAATTGVTVIGGMISNVGVGVLLDNDNPPSGDAPPKATRAALAGVTITGASTTGIEVRDDQSNNVTAAQPFTAPVTLTTDAQTIVTNSAKGVELITPPVSQYKPTTIQSTAVLVDSGLPTVTLTSTPDSVTSGSDSIFTYTATDNLTTSGDLTVLYFVDGNGAFPASGGTIDLKGLKAGPHTFGIMVIDQAGNQAGTGYQWTVTQAQTPAPSLNLARSSDTGSRNDDRITSNTTPIFAGGALPGSTVALYATGGTLNGTTLLGTTTAGSDGQWDFTVGGPGTQGPSSLADGSYTLYATATAAGDLVSGASPTTGLVVDTTTPGVTLTSTPGSTTAQTSATFAYSATQSPLATAYPLTYQYQLDNGALTALAANPLSLSNLSAGTHTLTLTATDVAGNTGSTTFTWTINSVQSPTIGLAAASDSDASNSDNVTNDTTPTFSGTATPGSTVALYAAGGTLTGTTLLGTTIAGSDGQWTFMIGGPDTQGPSSLADGSYTLYATATGPGDLGSVSSPNASLLVDTGTPAVTLTATPDSTTDQTAATFAYSAAQSPLTTAFPLTYQYQLDNGALTALTANPLSLSNLSAGSHTLTLTATDVAGNTGGTTFTWTITSVQAFTLGLAAGSDTGISNSDGITNDATPTFAGRAAPGSTVSVYASGGSPLPGPVLKLLTQLGLAKAGPVLLGTTMAGADGSWSFTVGGTGSTPGHVRLADGSYAITAEALSPGATTSNSAGPISLAVDTRIPTIHLTHGVAPNGPGWYNCPVTFAYTATAANGVALVDPTSGSDTFSTEGAGQTHVFTVSDAAGNTASVTTPPVSIDLTPPSSVTVSAALVSAGSNRNQFRVVVTGTMTDALSGAGKSTYSVLDADGDVVGGGAFRPNADGSYAFDVTIHTNRASAPSGPYTIVVGGADKAGNATLASTTIALPASVHPGH